MPSLRHLQIIAMAYSKFTVKNRVPPGMIARREGSLFVFRVLVHTYDFAALIEPASATKNAMA
jgi:hypothetical protein